MKPIKAIPPARLLLSWFNRISFKPDSFSFIQKVEESRNVLICMPAEVDRFAMARDLLSDFAEIFRPREVYIFLPFLEAQGYLSDSPGYQVIASNKEDLNVLSLPGKRLIHKLMQFDFGISLDLDLGDSFFNRYLCLKCKIPLRIGPKTRSSFPLYNVQLGVIKGRLGSREVYEGMANMLRTLFLPTERQKSNRG